MARRQRTARRCEASPSPRRGRRSSLAAALALACAVALPAASRGSDGFDLSGYLQAMPVWVRSELPEPLGSDSFLEMRLQQRLNLRWDVSPSLTVNWQMRTRLFAGDLARRVPGYADLVGADDGYVDLSWTIAEGGSWFLHYLPDRLNVEWMDEGWRVTVGRQRIHWGINTVTNPNDLFNIYSVYEFDYPERPGTDALRVQRFLDWGSRLELAVSPAREGRESVAAALYAFNTRGYDVQVIGGYYRDRLAVGGGWAGSIARSGFKGEVMLFSDLSREPGRAGAGDPADAIDAGGNGRRERDLVVALSGDHMFEGGLFLIVEALYNGAGGRRALDLLGEPPAADNPSVARYQITAQGSYAFSPLWSGALAGIWLPDDGGFFVSPSLTRSLTQDLDLNLLAQVFAGGQDSAFAHAGPIVAAGLRWSY